MVLEHFIGTAFRKEIVGGQSSICPRSFGFIIDIDEVNE